jgi:hypothetical protein
MGYYLRECPSLLFVNPSYYPCRILLPLMVSRIGIIKVDAAVAPKLPETLGLKTVVITQVIIAVYS